MSSTTDTQATTPTLLTQVKAWDRELTRISTAKMRDARRAHPEAVTEALSGLQKTVDESRAKISELTVGKEAIDEDTYKTIHAHLKSCFSAEALETLITLTNEVEQVWRIDFPLTRLQLSL